MRALEPFTPVATTLSETSCPHPHPRLVDSLYQKSNYFLNLTGWGEWEKGSTDKFMYLSRKWRCRKGKDRL